jgi:hypothetical protein
MTRKRSKVWPLTRQEAAIIRSLERVFWLAASLTLSLDRRSEPNGVEAVVKSLKALQRGIGSHCRRFAGEGEVVRELVGAYRTLGLDRVRMRRTARMLKKPSGP